MHSLVITERFFLNVLTVVKYIFLPYVNLYIYFWKLHYFEKSRSLGTCMIMFNPQILILGRLLLLLLLLIFTKEETETHRSCFNLSKAAN